MVFNGLMGLWAYFSQSAEYARARALAEEAHAIAVQVNEPRLLLWGEFILGQSLMFQGEQAPAQERLEHACALAESLHGQMHRATGAPDPRVTAPSALAHSRWLVGFPDQA